MDSLSWLATRTERLWTRDAVVDGASAALAVFRFQATTNSTSAAINEDKYASAKSIRTSTIILACVNIVAALATAAIIFWDSYTRSKRRDSTFRFRSAGLSFIRPCDSFPLMLSIGIFIQGIIFTVVQSTGLQALLVLGCTVPSQIMFPATFIVPYMQLIFGLEITYRALRPGPFKPQRKWTVTACLCLLVSMLLVHFIVTVFIRPPNLCFASLFWFLQRYSTECFGLLLAIAATLTLATAALFFKLKKDAKIDLQERVAASQMVYYMAIAILSNALLLPFFYSLSFQNQREAGPQTLQLSLVSAVVANVSGLTTGGLYLFLRSNTLSNIEPKGGDSIKAGLGNAPGTGFSGNQSARSINIPPPLRRTDSTESLILREKEEEAMIESPVVPTSLGSTSTYSYDYSLASGERTPAGHREGDIMVDLVPDSVPPTPNSAYPPTRGVPSMQSVALLPATTYTPYSGTTPRRYQEEDMGEFLMPPPAVLGPDSIRHRRDSSMSSSATVQIGLRFSNVEDMPPITSRYFQDSNKVYSINVSDEKSVLMPPAKRPSPLSVAMVDSDQVSQRTPSSIYDGEILLSSKVYNPQSPTRVRLPSPRGVGFGQPQLPPKKPWI